MSEAVKRCLVQLSFPLVYLLNRPSLYRLHKLLFNIALRGMGVAVSYSWGSGITVGEERFITRIGRFVAGRTVLDVGASVGAYACAVRSRVPSVTVYAFEPHPIPFLELKRRAEHMGFRALQVAMNDRPGPTQLFDFNDVKASTQASLSRDAVLFFQRGVRTFDVECMTIDSFLEANGIDHIAVLKIDTEGFDFNVLKGAERALARGKIDIIQFELIPASVVCRVFLKDFFDLLPQYTIHRLCLNGDLIALQPYEPKYCEIFSMSILIAVRQGVRIFG